MSKLKWKAQKIIGLDCAKGRCVVPGCPGKQGGKGHGAISEKWIYSQTNSDAAIVLTVSTNIFPMEKVLERREIESEGMDVTLHVFTSGGTTCDHSPTGFCRPGGSSGLTAHEMFRDHGNPKENMPQPDALWRALSDLFYKWYVEYLQEQEAFCPCCKGTGLK